MATPTRARSFALAARQLLVFACLGLAVMRCSDDTSTPDAHAVSDARSSDALRDGARADGALDARPDGSVSDGGGCPGAFPFSGPDCCDGQGDRRGSAACEAGQWRCEAPATLCLCGGEPQQFICSDVCGSDVFLAPTCVNDAWTCGRGQVRTTDCPPGTCWGDPGQCCDADGQPVAPVCNNGAWEWAAPCAVENCS